MEESTRVGAKASDCSPSPLRRRDPSRRLLETPRRTENRSRARAGSVKLGQGVRATRATSTQAAEVSRRKRLVRTPRLLSPLVPSRATQRAREPQGEGRLVAAVPSAPDQRPPAALSVSPPSHTPGERPFRPSSLVNGFKSPPPGWLASRALGQARPTQTLVRNRTALSRLVASRWLDLLELRSGVALIDESQQPGKKRTEKKKKKKEGMKKRTRGTD